MSTTDSGNEATMKENHLFRRQVICHIGYYYAR
jgi:hypothetical protein